MKIIALLMALLLAAPTFAAGAPRKSPTQNAASSRELTKQETIALGANRFLIISGSAASNNAYGYTIDLIKLDNGIPHFDPLFMEEYAPETNTAHLEYGIAFMATSYNFDKAYETLTLTTDDFDTHTRYQLHYKLDVDIFKLLDVVSQAICDKTPCTPTTPKTVYTAQITPAAKP